MFRLECECTGTGGLVTSRRLLEVLQSALQGRGLISFISAAEVLRLNVVADGRIVHVIVGDSEPGCETYVWRDVAGELHEDSRAGTVAWLRGWAAGG